MSDLINYVTVLVCYGGGLNHNVTTHKALKNLFGIELFQFNTNTQKSSNSHLSMPSWVEIASDLVSECMISEMEQAMLIPTHSVCFQHREATTRPTSRLLQHVTPGT